MPHFTLVIQHPKLKVLGVGSLSIGKDGTAEFYEGNAGRYQKVRAETKAQRDQCANAL